MTDYTTPEIIRALQCTHGLSVVGIAKAIDADRAAGEAILELSALLVELAFLGVLVRLSDVDKTQYYRLSDFLQPEGYLSANEKLDAIWRVLKGGA